jgi:hypothetical protein
MDDKSRFDGELSMNQDIADIADEIIDRLGLVNVHLLGKCNGAWVVLQMLLKEKEKSLRDSKFKAMYLAVPGIPFGVSTLSEISSEKLSSLHFMFGWIKQDAFNFQGWGRLSYQEPERYSEQLSSLGLNKDQIIKLYDVGGEPDASKYHEVHHKLIDDILSSL